MKCKVQWDYKSSLVASKLIKGDQVDLPDKLVAAINRDSPNVLKPIKEKSQNRLQSEADGEREEPEAEVGETVGVPERGVEEPITKETFKAVK